MNERMNGMNGVGGWELAAADPGGHGTEPTAVTEGMVKGPTPPPAMAARNGVATPDDGLGQSSSPLGVLDCSVVVSDCCGCGSVADW